MMSVPYVCPSEVSNGSPHFVESQWPLFEPNISRDREATSSTGLESDLDDVYQKIGDLSGENT